MMTTSICGVLACAVAVALECTTTAQAPVPPTQVPPIPRPVLVCDQSTRIADPKLEGGAVVTTFHLTPLSAKLATRVEVRRAGGLVQTVWTGPVLGTDAPRTVTWDGTDALGKLVATGDYTLRVCADGSGPVLDLPLRVVRLGVTEIEFQDAPGLDNEWQMVYFKKNNVDSVFFSTPSIHEYCNSRDSAEGFDLDLDDGSPRPAVLLHTATDEPVMNGLDYATEGYNYPLAYVRGTPLRLEATLGAGGTSASGAPMAPGYPVAGFDLRLVAGYSTGLSVASQAIAPGMAVPLDGPTAPVEVGRWPLDVTWRFEYAPSGTSAWSPVPGWMRTSHRVYTLYGTPEFKAAATGTQYVGPWVEVAEDLAAWNDALAIDTSTSDGVIEAFVKGFFGQNGGIPTAIEGVVYDASPLGGDGGANHYYNAMAKKMDLSALLNAHARGKYVNCSDCMGATTTSLAMLGIPGIRPVRLGTMKLKAIWGIGAPAYTTALWGSSHSFSYHHVVTRTDGVTVIDTCMQLDEDGDPLSTPGVPGWNNDRPWDGPNGYDELSSTNTVNRTLQALPGLY